MVPYSDYHRNLLAQVEELFSKKQPLLTIWQEMAENFYPERADFTVIRNIGDQFADNLSTSAPMLMRRQLGDQLSAMLRPEGTTWAHMTTDREDRLDLDARSWLERKTKVMMRAMLDPLAKFDRATKEADHDFATFGQAVISVEVNRERSTLLYRTWHLRDVVWREKWDRSIGLRARRDKMYACDIAKLWPSTVHAQVLRMVNSNNKADAYKEVNVRHIVVPTDEYEPYAGTTPRFPFISIFLDVDNKCVLQEQPIATGFYIIPRWETVSGSQYAHSPATMAGLPDARLLQTITFTLLKAGEKAVDPPMIAVEEMIKSPIDIQPGGVTFVDADYDEKTGEVLRPMTVDSRGIPVGLNMQDRIQAGLVSAFFIDKMQLPQFDHEMTAYEVSKRLQEYIRQALPLFGPIETEYNAPLCEDTFTLLLMNNAFGPTADIPPSLSGANIRFRFESPLVQAEDDKLVQIYNNMVAMLQASATFDPGAYDQIDNTVALRDALRGGQVPASWMASIEVAQKKAEARRKLNDMSQALNVAQQGADVASGVGQAKQAFGG